MKNITLLNEREFFFVHLIFLNFYLTMVTALLSNIGISLIPVSIKIRAGT
jgi:hypothetical protein